MEKTGKSRNKLKKIKISQYDKVLISQISGERMNYPENDVGPIAKAFRKIKFKSLSQSLFQNKF